MSLDVHPIPKIGVSACLLGHQVRYDGGHKHHQFLTGELEKHVDYVPICPETSIGLGTPRPSIHLVGDYDHPRVVGVDDPNIDVTRRLEKFAESQVNELLDLSGFILKKGSPSCGMARVKVTVSSGKGVIRKGSGVFARILMQRLSLLPVAEEICLNNAVLRENFINRIYVYQRWQHLNAGGLTAARLIDFHTTHKYMLMAHSQTACQRLDKLLTNLSTKKLEFVADHYIEELMKSLKRRVSRKRHMRVLLKILEYMKRRPGGEDTVGLAASIEYYSHGETPLVTPIMLLRHYLHNHRDAYMEKQHYLHPYPEGLGLRNTI